MHFNNQTHDIKTFPADVSVMCNERGRMYEQLRFNCLNEILCKQQGDFYWSRVFVTDLYSIKAKASNVSTSFEIISGSYLKILQSLEWTKGLKAKSTSTGKFELWHISTDTQKMEKNTEVLKWVA